MRRAIGLGGEGGWRAGKGGGGDGGGVTRSIRLIFRKLLKSFLTA